MLVLTRKIAENIIISDDIIVSILEINGSQVRLGIEAPKNISIHREEVFLKILKEKEEQRETEDVEG